MADAKPKKPNPIDVHVGSRVRLRRTMQGMSQEKLGDALGITFQQIQKYEKGTNRIGASRMQQIAAALKVPVSFFFEDAPAQPGAMVQPGMAEASATSYVVDFVSSAEGIALNRAFVRIPSATIRRKVIEMVRALADETGEPEGKGADVSARTGTDQTDYKPS
ncbi:MAG: helix-turn-helix transcriptional regulator [Pseudomonadota bacterium]